MLDPVIASRSARAAAPGWFADGRRRRRRQRHRRADRRAARAAPRAGCCSSPRRCSTPARPAGRRAASPPRSRPTTAPDAHYADTLTAGAGLCDPAAVRVLVDEGPDRVRDLAALGAAFDRDPRRRARADPRGRAPAPADRARRRRRDRRRGRARAARRGRRRRRHRGHRARPRPRPADGRRRPRLRRDAARPRRGQPRRRRRGPRRAPSCSPPAGWARSTPSTTNPDVSTGDGVARRAARRRGARRPRVRAVPPDRAVARARARPAGSRWSPRRCVARARVLLDAHGRRVMADVHPLADLAPRDVVAKQMSRGAWPRSASTTSTSTPAISARSCCAHRFPTIARELRRDGIDPVTEPVPVAPAAHYASGGVRTDLHGRTQRARSVCLRRGGVHRRARRQPAGVELPARGPRLRHPRSARRSTRRARVVPASRELGGGGR